MYTLAMHKHSNPGLMSSPTQPLDSVSTPYIGSPLQHVTWSDWDMDFTLTPTTTPITGKACSSAFQQHAASMMLTFLLLCNCHKN